MSESTETDVDERSSPAHEAPTRDVAIVGAGVAGLSAGIFTARAGLETVVVNHGESILNRNAHIENVPGFPAGVNSRLYLEMTRDQAERAGCEFVDARVERVDETDGGFVLALDDGTITATQVIAASWSDSDYLADLDVELRQRGSKTYVGVDPRGYTAVDGLYAAGRLAEQYHQAIVAAGHGAQVALTLIEESEIPYYHDWIAPEGYFTGRGREVPPGCEEIDEDERKRREAESMETMREYFAEPHPGEPTMHPSVDR